MKSKSDSPVACAQGFPATSAKPVRVVTLECVSHREFFITAEPGPGECAASVFAKAAREVQSRGATIISQDIFGMEEGAKPALRRAFGPIQWPVTWVYEARGSMGLAGTQIWAVEGAEVLPIIRQRRIWGSVLNTPAATWCRLGGLSPVRASAAVPEQARSVFARMDSTLAVAGLDFSDVARTWFFNNEILDWYGPFNNVRDKFFRSHRVFDGLVPASTGIGGGNPAGAALQAGVLAVRPRDSRTKVFAVPSPLQCPALDYGSSFSRAVEVAAPDHRRVLISGTASIAPGGETVCLGDMEGQVGLTMEVVAAILESRGMGWRDVTRAIAYVKRAKDVPVFDRYRAARGMDSVPFVTVVNDVCRGNLLFEVELDAAVAGR